MAPTDLSVLLSNHVILTQLAPLLPLTSLLHLTAISHSLRKLLLSSPPTFSRLDLRPITSATLPLALRAPLDRGGTSFRTERMDEALTEDDFYAGPLRGIFGRLGPWKLSCVGTMILDGLCVPADLVREVMGDERFAALRVLSLRGCEHLNDRVLGQGLRYAVRDGRPAGMPRLRALYVFGPGDGEVERVVPQDDGHAILGIGIMGEEGAQIGGQWGAQTTDGSLVASRNRWYRQDGEVLKGPTSEWAETLVACKGIIAFDAVLCRGPKHNVETAGDELLGPCIANYSLGGCANCGSSPEGPAVYGNHEETALPLLAPPPLHSTTIKAAQQPDGTIQANGKVKYPPLILRCQQCIRNRHCNRCNKWWCEKCYQIPKTRQTSQQPRADRGEDGSYWGAESQVKVYLNVCVETCLRSEILAVVDGMWG